jgi:thioredoxin-like negative regulator of GroEL
LAVLVLASVALAVFGILMLKDQRQEAVAQPATQTAPAQAEARPAGQSSPAPMAGPVRSLKPADQLQEALAVNKPALVFMHSTSCQSCIDMTAVVNQVYPEFAERVTLVDVDVYDEANGPLMQVLKLQYIPTVVVFDSEGKATQNVGVMKPDAFRRLLAEHALGG